MTPTRILIRTLPSARNRTLPSNSEHTLNNNTVMQELVVLVLRHLDAVAPPVEHSPVDWWLLCAAYTASGTSERKKAL